MRRLLSRRWRRRWLLLQRRRRLEDLRLREGDRPQLHQRTRHEIADGADEPELARPLERQREDQGEHQEVDERALLLQREPLLAAVADREIIENAVATVTIITMKAKR